ncbi:hydroxyethylthiazole kinase [Rubrivivax gelatinosus]|uniref:Hydroxyethylthiazole kinase n=1 Tax=Rubrivivax gelatinosus TaxID=28068 RepID=A0ABS1DSX2_RUBGE|nr:hydroxyethylthiazole kinase [Rubrivivax gelatinosus]MBK1712231.1 hydroxyethylthiazole kinase [Rubrivivax gelatinosus]
MARTTLEARDLWADIEALRQRRPLVHSITNVVVSNFNANVLLAAGASPVMTQAHEELADMVAIAQALVLNIGTLDAYAVEAMTIALRAANARAVPAVLDPVGAGATPYRNRTLAALLAAGRPTAIRGNASEIMSLAGEAVATRGVDSSAGAEAALAPARALAARTGAVVCVSGAVDHVVAADGRVLRLANGHEWMTRITGVGCSLTALVGAFCAVQPDAWRATAAATALMGVAGEIAAEQARARGAGVGTMAALLVDALQLVDEAGFLSRARIEHD